MANERPGDSHCASTGLAVPECSCRNCLEQMLGNFRPELLSGEIRISRTSEETGEHRELHDRPG